MDRVRSVRADVVGEERFDVGPDRLDAGMLDDTNHWPSAAQRLDCGRRVGLGKCARHVADLGDLEPRAAEEVPERVSPT
jgi:hypothetical protein